MKKIWAPWRVGYITGKQDKGCIFCGHTRNDAVRDRKKLVLDRSGLSFVMMNKYPYNNGHMMIAPFRHVGDFARLTDKEVLDMMRLVRRAKRALDRILRPDGYNMGINIGRTGGAGVTGHIHLHIVPRWDGDHNFMPVLSGTKVISQSLADLYGKMKKVYDR